MTTADCWWTVSSRAVKSPEGRGLWVSVLCWAPTSLSRFWAHLRKLSHDLLSGIFCLFVWKNESFIHEHLDVYQHYIYFFKKRLISYQSLQSHSHLERNTVVRDLNRVFLNFTRDWLEVRCGFTITLICNTTSLHCDQLAWGKKRAEEERIYFLLCLLEASNNSHSQQIFTPVLPTLSTHIICPGTSSQCI